MPPYNALCQPATASRWVQRFAPLVPAGAAVLDLACGGGRHARFFLDRGAAVTCIDRDIGGLGDLAGRAEIIAADLETGGEWPLASRHFDAIVVVNYLHRPLAADLLACLAPGGVLLYETFASGNERYDRPRNPDHLLRSGELLALAGRRGLRILAYEDGIEQRPVGPRAVQRICAIDREQPAFLPEVEE